MTLTLKILVLVFGAILFSIFIAVVRKKSVKPFYSALWLIISLFIFSFVLFERFYKWIATMLNISDASFLVIVGLISFLLVYVMYLSIKISVMSDRIQELISQTSILEHELRKSKPGHEKAN